MNTEENHPFAKYSIEIQACLFAMRTVILSVDASITERMAYGMPFFYYNNKRFCYLWVHKKYKQPYIGVIEGGKVKHPQLLLEKRSQIRIFLVDPLADLPLEDIQSILRQAISFC